MRELFKCEVGLSDHTMGIGTSVAAVAHGATVIEKHFTLARKDGGVDSSFSLEPREFKSLVVETERAWQSLGEVIYGGVDSEDKSKKFRRSIYISNDMRSGDFFTKDNIKILRPGLGLPPKYFDIIIGKKINKNAKKGTAVAWDLIS